MNFNCEFCKQSVVNVCCYKRCLFNPFICGKQCISQASFKVHFHESSQSQNQELFPFINKRQSNYISMQQLNNLIVSKKQADFISSIKKSSTRITQKINSITKQFEDLCENILTLDPNIKQILNKIQSSDRSLSGNNIYTLINQQFYNPLNPHNKLLSQFQSTILCIYNTVQQLLQQYQMFSQRQQESNKLFKQSGRLILEQNYNESLILLNKAIELNPINPNILLQISYCYQKLHQYEQSISNYEQIISYFPQISSHAFNNIGSIYFKCQEYQKSIQFYSKAISINDKISKYYFNRGNTYSYLQINQQAIYDFSRAIELNPFDPSYYCNRGIAYKQIADYQNSYLDFVRANELGDNPDYLFNRDIVLALINERSYLNE